MRELQNCIEHAVILNDAREMRSRHFDLGANSVARIEQPVDPWDLLNLLGTLEEASGRIHAEFERHKLAQVMREAKSNPRVAAAALKIGHRDLVDKLKRYRLD